MPQIFKNYINGEWLAKGSQGTFENLNPADKAEVVGIFPKSGPQEVEAAVEAADRAQPGWARVPAPRRGEILKKVGDILVARKNEIAELMTREMGKVIKESRGDVQEGIDCAYYYAGEGRRLFGDTTPSELDNKFAMSMRRPVGVCGIITPWNFPMAIPTWKAFPALVCGNTLIFKPASDTPATAVKLVEVFEEAGVPKGVVNLVHGGGSLVGNAIVNHPKVRLISFTGSSSVGRDILQACGKRLARCSLELGGKNAQAVMEDADLELAVDGALWGAFGTTGQRCTATSRIILHKAIAKKFTELFVEKTRKLVLGNGLDPKSEVGPVVNQGQIDTVSSYVKIGKDEGAELLCGGETASEGSLKNGFFFKPTVFGGVKRNMRLFQEEIFGPVVAITEVKDFEEAIAAINDSAYGLSSSVYTRDVNRAFQAVRDIEAGITYINVPTIGAEVHLPFGGVKDTGNGHREAGRAALDVFSEWKAVYIDFSGKLQKAQIDTHADD
jgi:aldehyde dehydrogenase (NAD+)